MAFYNMSGTSEKTFKIGPNGVSLTSKEIVSGESAAIKYLITNQKDADGNELRLAYEKTTEPIYDTFIKSSDVSTIQYTDSQVKFVLRNGNVIILNQNFGDVKGPNSSTDNAIALFDGTSGKQLKDSGAAIANQITDTNADSTDVATINAVVGYVGTLSEALKKRLEGSL